MEIWIVIGVIVGVYFLAWMNSLRESKKYKRFFIARLKREYGKIQEIAYSDDRAASENGYYLKHQDAFCIDDITWNDLDMERVYRSINHCYSSAGDEYLYYRLHAIRLKESKEEEWEEECVRFLDANEEERIRLQIVFAQLGRTGKFSVYRYIEYLDRIKEKKLVLFILSWIVYAVFIGIMFVNLPIGLVGIGLFALFNIVTYMKQKKEIEPYITSFQYILRILKTAQILGKSVPDVWKEQGEELLSLRKKTNTISDASLNFIGKSSSSKTSMDILEILIDYLKMIFHIDLFIFYRMLSQVKNHYDDIDRTITILGMLESQISIAAFRASLKEYCVPELNNHKGMEAVGIFHPLIEDAVANEFAITKGMLLTGSNASGKSTFLKTIAINALLAQSIHTVAAHSYSAEYYRIFSSMALRDDLMSGESYYIVEIRSLKRIMDAASIEGTQKVLCFVDEVLRGTNTIERIAASTEIMKTLSQSNTLCFAATHDIELTSLLEKDFENYHFEEEIVENDVIFSYCLLKGKATTRNAIQLLKVLGYPDAIISSANEMARIFTESGEWKRL